METQEEADADVRSSSRLRRIAVGTVGGIVTLGGIALLALPGPGLLVVVGGLAILASEFDWAKSALDKARGKAQVSAEKSASSRASLALTVAGGLLLIAAGVLCFLGEDFGIPLVDKLNSPVTGAFLVLSGLIVIGLTAYQRVQIVQAGHRGEGPLARG